MPAEDKPFQPEDPLRSMRLDETINLDATMPASDATPASSASAKSIVQSEIGPYRLLKKLGEGGMGGVWMAEQQYPVKRRVALKLIKEGMGSKDIIARFEAERQALALMNHQFIAHILDAGTTADSRPYFVMELIEGSPITQFCDEHKMDVHGRLRLMVSICEAIQHAHQKGIIHRDLKPSNILVTELDGQAIPKIIDFGLVKVLQQSQHLTESTLQTQLGQVLGTLQYMSPEQAELRTVDIDTRTDIYSLGVLLYELLVGSTPIEREDLQNRSLLQILMDIREKEFPLPSSRLSTSASENPKLFELRQTTPRILKELLRGDLDWIVARAIEKDRSRRYPTAIAMADDVMKFITGDVISARPPSATYAIKKLASKHRGLAFQSPRLHSF